MATPTYSSFAGAISLGPSSDDINSMWTTTLGGATTGTSTTTDCIQWSTGKVSVAELGGLEPAVKPPETEKEWLRRRVDEMLWKARN